jgi:glycosyltransferase involved in cell wall biosynthesis
VLLSMDPGGLELVVLDLLREGRRLGQRVEVLCLESPGLLAAEVEAMQVGITCLDKRAGLHPGLIGPLRSHLRRIRPDVVHTHQIGALFYAGAAARGMKGTRVVHTEHGVHYPGRLRTRLLARVAASHADRFFCVSKDIAATVLRYHIAPGRKVAVVPNGIDTARFIRRGDREALRRVLGLPAGVTIIGTVGRLDPIKRQDLLIRAFARVRQRERDAHLLLVGDGPALDDLRRLTAALGLDPSVTFAGYQPRPERYLEVMDVFALTSRSEGMPLAVLEAWAAGVPVIASRVGGIPELITNGWTGLLFEPGEEGELARAILRMIADPAWSRRMGEAGRDLSRALYDVRVMAGTYDLHYRTLGERPRRSRR